MVFRVYGIGKDYPMKKSVCKKAENGETVELLIKKEMLKKIETVVCIANNGLLAGQVDIRSKFGTPMDNINKLLELLENDDVKCHITHTYDLYYEVELD